MVVRGQNRNSLIEAYYIDIRPNSVFLNIEGDKSFYESGGSLFDFSIDRLLGKSNYIETSFQMIILLNNIVADKNFNIREFGTDKMDFSGMSYELNIYTDSKYTYLERWGVCARITTLEFLSIFIEIHAFLLRWNNRKLIIDLIYDIFINIKKSNLEYKENLIVKKLNEKDYLRFGITEEKLNLNFDEYIASLEFPSHLAE